MLCYVRAEQAHVVLRSVPKKGHVTHCILRRRSAGRSRTTSFHGENGVTWYSVPRAKQSHMRSNIRERKEVENGVRLTTNQKIIPPQ
ncbi:hypothetical protein chiPu_0021961 [Chiloscyllium punctatum]|uniref:Uncharacterized protein n=1 Tax=Chiloscyllium punctatum TaxID=137246 RepID=A0A401RG71_CHIPU|nr:hypothetical protein [Chiloscyllium punctatum]